MADNLINIYISEKLKPLLKLYNIDSEIIDLTVNDIYDRLASIASRWSNYEFRRTILVTGYEEAFFYEPPADLDIRAMVVVTVRNSIIEELCSTKEAARKLGLRKPAFSDDDVRIFTRDAINYFSQFNFSKDLHGITLGRTDTYGKLHDLYPVAWEALKHLGDWSNQHHVYMPLKREPMELECLYALDDKFRFIEEVKSGMDPEIDGKLLRELQSLRPGNSIFLSDSFKSITRNPDKFFKVIEYILSTNSMLVTSNFHITNGYVARRNLLLKPGHNKKDMTINFNNFYGLRKSHREALQTALKALEQV